MHNSYVSIDKCDFAQICSSVNNSRNLFENNEWGDTTI